MKKPVFLFLTLFLLSGCGEAFEALDKGKKYGEEHTLGDCADQAMSYLEACKVGDLSCTMLPLGFSRGCAKTASPDPEFCKPVPDDIIKATAWIKSTCGEHAYPEACFKVLKLPVARCFD